MIKDVLKKWVSAGVALAMAMACFPIGAFAAEQKTTLRIDPEKVQLTEVGQITKVDILISNVEYLQGIDLTLNYNPSQLDIVDVSGKAVVKVNNGNVFRSPDTMIFKNEVNHGKGKILFIGVYTGHQTYFSGSGVILSYYVKAKTLGKTNLTFETTANPVLAVTDSSLILVKEVKPILIESEIEVKLPEIKPVSSDQTNAPGKELAPETKLVPETNTASENTPLETALESPSEPLSTFVPKDVKGHWAEAQILQLVNEQIVSGYVDGNFYPNKVITKTEFVKMLVSAMKIPLAEDLSLNFKDAANVPKWAVPYVATAAQAGWISGDANKVFNGSKPLTRAEMAVILAKAQNLTDTNKELSKAVVFKDAQSIPSWANQGIYGVVANGLMSGTPEGFFKPVKGATRGEVAKVLVYMTNLAE